MGAFRKGAGRHGRIAVTAASACLVLSVSGCTPEKQDFSAEKERETREFMERARGGPSMMGPGMTGSGIMMGPGFGMMGTGRRGDLNLTRNEVEAYFVNHLAQRGDGRYRVGGVRETDKGIFIVDIVTADGVPVTRYEVDRHTGLMRPAR